MTRKMHDLMRLAASVTVSIILLPFILRLYLALSPDATANEVWLSLVQAAPFGEAVATTVIAVWGEAQSGIDALLDWLLSQKLTFPQHFSMELGELIFTSVLVLVISGLIGRKLFQDTQGGFFNNAANAVFQVLLTFTASLVADIIMNFYTTQLVHMEGVAHDVWAWIYAIGLSGGGIWMLIVCGVLFLDAILLIAIGCLKITTSYGFFLWLLLIEMRNGSTWMLCIGVICWLVMLWLLQCLESIFLPKG